MVRLPTDEMDTLMERPSHIRNISVIGYIDHGAQAITEALKSEAGIVCPAINHDMDSDENVNIQSTVISLCYKPTEESAAERPNQECPSPEFLINLMTPGYIELSSSTLRISDGALVIVNAVAGFLTQTGTTLRIVLGERVKPVLVLNKIDVAILELNISKEELYQFFVRIIDSVNATIELYRDPTMGDLQISPAAGTVAFTCDLHQWGFTLRQFAARYARKFGVNQDKLEKLLWGDNYFDPGSKKWTRNATGGATDAEGKPLERAFNTFVLDPIMKIFGATMGTKLTPDEISSILEKLDITLEESERALEGRLLLRAIMRRFLPISDALLSMAVIHLPSPVAAQRYRAAALYEGPMAGADVDAAAAGIRACDPAAPLVLWIARVIPSSSGATFALGRVFSGTIRGGQIVRIQGPKYTPGSKDNVRTNQSVERPMLIVGRTVRAVEDCPSGNVVGLAGFNAESLQAGATLTTEKETWNIRNIKFYETPVEVSVEVENVVDLPKLVRALRFADTLSRVDVAETGEHILSAVNEAHLSVVLQDVRADLPNVPLKISEPLVSYRESVAAESANPALAKSPNKHSRLYVKAIPLGEELANAIEDGKVGPTALHHREQTAERARVLAHDYGWEMDHGRRLWAFGPGTAGTGSANVLVDTTHGVQYLNEMKDACITGWRWATKEGVCADEPVRGVRFNIVDVTALGDAIHRGAGQIIPTMRRASYASMLLSQPTLNEPVLFFEIECPQHALGPIYSCLEARNAEIIGQEQHNAAPMFVVKSHVPLRMSFGLRDALQKATSGEAFVQSAFNHWGIVPGSPLDNGTVAGAIVSQIRARKGLKPELPSLEQYLDKL